MTKSVYTMSAAMLCFFPAAAFAELTAQGVWEEYRSFAESLGQTVSVEGESSGDGILTLNGVTFSAPMDMSAMAEMMETLSEPLEISGLTSVSLDEVVFREENGQVIITQSDDWRITSTTQLGDEAPDVTELTATYTDMVSTVSETAEGLSIVSVAPKGSLVINEISSMGEEFPIVVSLTMDELESEMLVSNQAEGRLLGDVSVKTVGFEFDFEDAGTRLTGTGSYSGLKARAELDPKAIMNLNDPLAIYRGDIGLSVLYTHEGGALDFSVTDQGELFKMASSSASGRLETELSGPVASYSIGADDVSVTFEADGATPLPETTVDVAQLGFGLALPLAKSEELQDVFFNLSFIDLMAQEELWAMADPMSVLPREPLSVIIDLAGKARSLVDMSDPTAMQNVQMPFEIDSLEVKNVEISGLGAAIKAFGGFTFNMDDLQTFGGIPAPEGAVEISLEGINGLMDRLIEMGLLPQQEAGMARMVMGGFTRPVGEDSLVTEIKVDADGNVTANGQKLR